ncbi:MAG: ATP-binding protein, partial [Chloroflexota bacterium]
DEMPRIDPFMTAAWLSSALCLGAAVYAAGQWRYRRSSTRLSLAYALTALVWALQQAALPGVPGASAGLVERLPVYGLALLAAVFLALTRSVLGARRRPAAWLTGSVAWLGLLWVVEGGWAAAWLGSAAAGQAALALQIGACVLGAIWTTARTMRQTTRYDTLVSYWGVALLLGAAGDGMFFFGWRLPGLLLRQASVLLSVYAASAPRLPEISHILRQWLNRLIYGSAVLLVYLALFSLALAAAGRLAPAQREPAALALALAAALVADPLLFRLRRRLRSWITGPRQDAAGMLRQYSQSLTHILDLNLLAATAVGTVAEILDIQRGFVFLVEHERNAENGAGFQVRGVKGMGSTQPAPCTLAEDSPLAACFRYDYRPLTRKEIEHTSRFQTAGPAEKAWLEQLGAEALIPVYAKNEWIGLLALGPKANGQEFTVKELELLSMLADQTAVALENTRLVEGLVRLNNDFRRAYSALDQANRNLERLDRTKSDFISISSHELRTPLTVINGTSQMLLDDPELQQNPYYRQLLTKLYNGAQRLHEIVDTMLDVAKIDSRALELEPQPVSISNLLLGVSSGLKKDLADRKLTLETSGLEALPSINADAGALRKVFYHLLVNAIKYTPDGGSITVSGQALAPSNGELRNGGIEVVVSDTGIGIDPQVHELIFTKFYQTGELALHSTGKTKFKGGGPGLGLAIVRGIVEAHHGRVWVESEGCNETACPGSRFHVRLPLPAPIR